MKITFTIDIEPQELFEIIEQAPISPKSEEDIINQVRQAKTEQQTASPFIAKMFDLFNQTTKPDPKQQEAEVLNGIGEQLLEQLKGNDAFLSLVRRFVSAQK